jgi:hypothetical protein
MLVPQLDICSSCGLSEDTAAWHVQQLCTYALSQLCAGRKLYQRLGLRLQPASAPLGRLYMCFSCRT